MKERQKARVNVSYNRKKKSVLSAETKPTNYSSYAVATVGVGAEEMHTYVRSVSKESFHSRRCSANK